MEIQIFEKRVMLLVSRGILNKYTAADIINRYAENEDKREAIDKSFTKAEKLNDEDPAFFVKLNQIINEIL